MVSFSGTGTSRSERVRAEKGEVGWPVAALVPEQGSLEVAP